MRYAPVVESPGLLSARLSKEVTSSHLRGPLLCRTLLQTSAPLPYAIVLIASQSGCRRRRRGRMNGRQRRQRIDETENPNAANVSKINGPLLLLQIDT